MVSFHSKLRICNWNLEFIILTLKIFNQNHSFYPALRVAGRTNLSPVMSVTFSCSNTKLLDPRKRLPSPASKTTVVAMRGTRCGPCAVQELLL